MTLKEMKQYVSQKTMDEIHVNSLEVIRGDEFNRKGEKTCYKKRAIDKVIELELDFCSEGNTWFEIMKRYVKIECPKCGSQMETGRGFGNVIMNNLNYECYSCGSTVNLSGMVDSFSMSFNK